MTLEFSDELESRRLSLPAWLWSRLTDVCKKIGCKRTDFVRHAIEDRIHSEQKWWYEGPATQKQLKSRVDDLEATLARVLKEARSDGREATTHEYQMTMRTAQAILDNKLKI